MRHHANLSSRSVEMERWYGKVGVVTGATTGIGIAICKALVQKGLLVVGLSRRIDKIEGLSKNLSEETGKLIGLKCDITREDDIIRSFGWITDHVGSVNVLINNAVLSKSSTLTEGSAEDWRRIFEVNVLSLSICTREAIKIMKEHNTAGHIIHINSVSGHYVPSSNVTNLNVFPASKFAVTALTETLRQELRHLKSRTKVTSISPGTVRTEFQDGFAENASKESLSSMPSLKPEDVADAVVYVLSTGPNVQVQELIIRPVGEKF